MKHLSNVLPKLMAVAAAVLSMSSCNRAEYAMLPKTTPYHATYGTTKSVPAPAGKKVADTEVAVAEPVEKKAAATVATPGVKAPLAAAPAAAATHKPTAAPAPRKLNLVQKLGVAKVLKQVDKAASKVQLKQRSETAGTKKLEGKLRQGVILIIVGLLLELVGAVTGLSIIYYLGAIIALIGVILIVLYLLDEI